MSSDLSVPRIAATAAAGEVARPHGGAPAEKPHADKPGAHPAASKALPNPTLRLDPGLAIVVIEFRDEAGAVRSSIPTEQQLDAYRAWDRTHGATPGGESPSVKASTTDAD
jgi:hypothetical protein